MTLSTCDEGLLEQHWQYYPALGFIRTHDGMCLDTDGHGPVHLWQCYPSNPNQMWLYDNSTNLIKTWDGRCISASSNNPGDATISITACSVVNSAERWFVGVHIPPTTTAPAVAARWLLAPYGQSCSDGCEGRGWTCDSVGMAALNGEISSNEGMARVVGGQGVACTAYDTAYGSAEDVPVVLVHAGLCFVSDPQRRASSWSCTASTADDKRRLCRCSVSSALYQKDVLPVAAPRDSRSMAGTARRRRRGQQMAGSLDVETFSAPGALR